jgi:hypothetical protein
MFSLHTVGAKQMQEIEDADSEDDNVHVEMSEVPLGEFLLLSLKIVKMYHFWINNFNNKISRINFIYIPVLWSITKNLCGEGPKTPKNFPISFDDQNSTWFQNYCFFILFSIV